MQSIIPSLPGHSPPVRAVSGSWEGSTHPQSPTGLHPIFFFLTAHLPCGQFPSPGIITPLLLQMSPAGPTECRDHLCTPKSSPPQGLQGSPGERWEPAGPQTVLLLVPKTSSGHAAYTEPTNLIESCKFKIPQCPALLSRGLQIFKRHIQNQ